MSNDQIKMVAVYDLSSCLPLGGSEGTSWSWGISWVLNVYLFIYFHLLTYEEVGSGCRQAKLLFHVLGCEGDLADDRVKPQDAPTKKQAVDWGSQQPL